MAVRLVVLLAVLALPAAPAAAAQKLQGTITWTTTQTTERDEPGEDAVSATTTQTATLRVRMAGRKGAAGWQPDDDGSTYTSRSTRRSTTVQRSFDGQPSCTIVTEGAARANGSFRRRPRGTTPPSLFGTVFGSTRGIVLTPLIAFRGTETTTETGSGPSPCTGGRDTGPYEGRVVPGDDAREVCVPAGTRGRPAAQAGTLLGVWRPRTRTFAFACSRTWQEGEGRTTTIRVSGSLRLR